MASTAEIKFMLNSMDKESEKKLENEHRLEVDFQIKTSLE